MSSYLTIKLIPKKKSTDGIVLDKSIIPTNEYMTLDSWSRSNTIYQLFKDEISPVFAYNYKTTKNGNFIYNEDGEIESEEVYTEITEEGLQRILEAAKHQKKNYEEQLQNYILNKEAVKNYKNLLKNTKNISDAEVAIEKIKDLLDVSDIDYTEEIKQELENIEYAICTITALLGFLETVRMGYSSFLGMVCNID